jgi:hypothetical protein
MASDHYVWLAWSIVFLVLRGIIFASFPDERRKMGVGEQWNTSIPKLLQTGRNFRLDLPQLEDLFELIVI